MNTLSKEKRAQVVSALAEGNSIRGTSRMLDVDKETVMKLGVLVGQGCKKLLDQRMTELSCTAIEVDEIWSFISKKQINTLPFDIKKGFGDTWVYLSICPKTKLMPTFLVGDRTRYNSHVFMEDLAKRLKFTVNLSTDSMFAYREAVADAFGANVNYGQLSKEYVRPLDETRRKYSAPKACEIKRQVIFGKMDKKAICTSHIERANLTLRQHCKRLSRLTLGFSRKRENHEAAIALHLAAYNFIKFHSSVQMTPAMAAGIETSPWTFYDLLDETL